ncbi:MAG: acyl-CoA dehydrogenase family protein, partial [Parasphingorhabdus sp.]
RLSHVIVDLRLLGVDILPIYDLTGDEHFAEVFFDDVELCSDSLIGEEGRGWQQVGAELAY